VKPSDSTRKLRTRLRRIGLSQPAIDAAWPAWWSDEAELSGSARAELRFSLARKLGLDPRSLLEDSNEPRFVWHDEARFKNLTSEGEPEQSALASFGMALGSVLAGGVSSEFRLAGQPAAGLRGLVLGQGRPFLSLADLLSLSWALGVPVVHLRILPGPNKRMAAMSVKIGGRCAVLLARDSMFPPHAAFYLAHEIAHIALEHLATNSAIVDLEPAGAIGRPRDQEEHAADRYALELLTGMPDPVVLPTGGKYSAKELGRVARSASSGLHIEPGTLALCFGYATMDWATANAAMRYIYSDEKPVWREINQVAVRQLALNEIADDDRRYLLKVLGGVT
jgi:hypothetical protein